MDLRLNRKGNSRTTRRDGNSVKLGKTPSISVSINGIRLEKKRKRNVQLPTPSPKKKTKEGTNWNRSKHSDPKMAKSQKSPQKKKNQRRKSRKERGTEWSDRRRRSGRKRTKIKEEQELNNGRTLKRNVRTLVRVGVFFCFFRLGSSIFFFSVIFWVRGMRRNPEGKKKTSKNPVKLNIELIVVSETLFFFQRRATRSHYVEFSWKKTVKTQFQVLRNEGSCANQSKNKTRH